MFKLKSLMFIFALFSTLSYANPMTSSYEYKNPNGVYAQLFEQFDTVKVVKTQENNQLGCYIEAYHGKGLKRATKLVTVTSEDSFNKNPLRACSSKHQIKKILFFY